MTMTCPKSGQIRISDTHYVSVFEIRNCLKSTKGLPGLILYKMAEACGCDSPSNKLSSQILRQILQYVLLIKEFLWVLTERFKFASPYLNQNQHHLQACTRGSHPSDPKPPFATPFFLSLCIIVNVRKPNVRFDKSNKKAFGYRTFRFLALSQTVLNIKCMFIYIKRSSLLKMPKSEHSVCIQSRS